MCYVYNQWYDISCATLYFEASDASMRKTTKAVMPLACIQEMSSYSVNLEIHYPV